MGKGNTIGIGSGVFTSIKTAKTQAENESQKIATGNKVSQSRFNPAVSAQVKKIGGDQAILAKVSENLFSFTNSLSTASVGVEKLTGLVQKCEALAAGIISGLDEKTRAIYQAEYDAYMNSTSGEYRKIVERAEFNGTKLLDNGAQSAVTVRAALAESLLGGQAVANGFAANLTAANSFGHFEGKATSVTVSQNNVTFDVSVVMDSGQTFTANGVVPAAGGTLTLVGNHANNRLSLTYDGAAVTALNNATNFKTALEQHLGIAQGAFNPTKARMLSTAVNGGIAANTDIVAGANTEAGTYSLYSDTNGVFYLNDGKNKPLTAQAVTGAQTLTFTNGVSVTLDNTYATGTAVTQVVFDVAAGNGISIDYLAGVKASQKGTVKFDSLSLSNMGIASSIQTVTDAETALTSLINALSTLTQSEAKIAAQQRRLDVTIENVDSIAELLDASVQAMTAADLGEANAKMTEASIKVQAGTIALRKLLELMQNSLQAVQ